MPYFLAPLGNAQSFDAAGNPLVGGSWRTFLAGTTTPATTFTSITGAVQQGTTMTLDSLGTPVNGPVWMLNGQALKFRLFNAASVLLDEWDNITGIGDINTAPDEWVLFTAAPTFVTATSFTVAGDQTNIFQPKRRLKSINTGGIVYSTIVSSVFTTVTTVTVTNTLGVLDAGLSAVSYALLAANNSSIPDVLPFFIGSLFGCTMSTAGASATMSIAAGRATDSTGSQSMVLTAIAKTTAAWAVGTAVGGLDTGAIAINSWYHYYVIRRPDTGVTDVIFSLNATAPALPSGYTQSRRIGSGRTNASSQWTAFNQNGDEFVWASVPTDINTSAQGTAAILYTLSTPSGIKTNAILAGYIGNAAQTQVIFLSPDSLDVVAGSNGQGFCAAGGFGGISIAAIRTNTASQMKVISQNAATIVQIATHGWIDARGRLV